MLHFILYVTKHKNKAYMKRFNPVVDYMFQKMEQGGFTFDIKYIEDNLSELTSAGVLDFTQPILKDIDGSFISGHEHIKEIIDAVVSVTE